MSQNATTVDALLAATPGLWKGNRTSHIQPTLASGCRWLDARLPGGGWPLGAVTEIITDKQGLGELSLLFPALADISHKGQWLIMIDPPWVPYPAALHGHGLALERLLLVRSGNARESLWACEQALKGSHGGIVLAWPDRISFARLRRLQLAAETNAKSVFLFRPVRAVGESSPAALRLYLQGIPPGQGTPDGRKTTGIRVNVLKCRGPQSPEPVWVNPPYSASTPSIHQPVAVSDIIPDTTKNPTELVFPAIIN
jgi:cell division inhibitor SulA/protein ImuA